MGGDHAARTRRTGAALQGTGGITLPGTRLRISHIPLGSSASAVARLLYCHVYRTVPRSAFFAKSVIAMSIGLPNLLFTKSVVWFGLPYC